VSSTRPGPEQEWLKLLRGGFAGTSAAFAVHPLDRARARRMRFLALRCAISDEAIVKEAERYLDPKSELSTDRLEEQLTRVSDFLVTCKLVRTRRRAWIVYRTGTDINREVVTVLDSRKSPDRVAELVEQLYMVGNYTVCEKLHYATRKHDNPYPAKIEWIDRRALITCGHNPWLEAKVVHNLKLAVNENGCQILTWDD